jgi:hypothetical protein
MLILGEFPKQVLILKGTRIVCSLSGRRSGLQERLTDKVQTKHFHRFVAALANGKRVDPAVEAQILAHGAASRAHLDQMLSDADGLRQTMDVLAQSYTRAELDRIVKGETYTQAMVHKLVPTILDISTNMFSDAKLQRRPSPAELPNTFLFRVALAAYLMAMRRGAFSAVTGVKPERIRNDMVDMTFVAYATYFDGVMSSDKNVNRIYEETCAMLTGLFKAKVPAVDALVGRVPMD